MGGYDNVISPSTTNGIILGGNTRTLDQAFTTVVETFRNYGGLQRNMATTALIANTTITYQSEIILVNSNAGIFTVSLPAVPVNGQYYVFIKTEAAANVVTISGNGKNIIGSATYAMATAKYTKIAFIYSSLMGEWTTA